MANFNGVCLQISNSSVFLVDSSFFSWQQQPDAQNCRRYLPIFKFAMTTSNNWLTQGNELVSCGNDLLTHGNKSVSCSNDLLTHGNELVSCNDLLTHGNESVSCSNDLLTHGNELVSCCNDFITHGNELVSCGNNLVSKLTSSLEKNKIASEMPVPHSLGK